MVRLSLQSSCLAHLTEQLSSAIKVPEGFQLASNYQSRSHMSPLGPGSQPPDLCQCLRFTRLYQKHRKSLSRHLNCSLSVFM